MLLMEIIKLQATILFLFSVFVFSSSQDYLGVTYGRLGANTPDTTNVAYFLADKTNIRNVRLFDLDTDVIKTLAAANMNIMISLGDNTLVTKLVRENPNLANDWAKSLVPFADKIDIFAFGYKVIDNSTDALTLKNLVTAMTILQHAFNAANLKIKVSTINSIDVLRSHDPPSNATFKPQYYVTMHMLLKFLRKNRSPFLTTAYPYYEYESNPTAPEALEYCLFEENAGKDDPMTNLKYTNMFDEQIDALRNAIDGFQYPEIDIIVAETGWPSQGDFSEVVAKVDYAETYLDNLVNYLRSNKGTPLMPRGVSRVYIHSLLDENLKNGPRSNRAFGIARYDLTWKYSSILSKNASSMA